MMLEMVAQVMCDHTGCDSHAEQRASLGFCKPEDFKQQAAGIFRHLGWLVDQKADRYLCPEHNKETK